MHWGSNILILLVLSSTPCCAIPANLTTSSNEKSMKHGISMDPQDYIDLPVRDVPGLTLRLTIRQPLVFLSLSEVSFSQVLAQSYADSQVLTRRVPRQGYTNSVEGVRLRILTYSSSFTWHILIHSLQTVYDHLESAYTGPTECEWDVSRDSDERLLSHGGWYAMRGEQTLDLSTA